MWHLQRVLSFSLLASSPWKQSHSSGYGLLCSCRSSRNFFSNNKRKGERLHSQLCVRSLLAQELGRWSSGGRVCPGPRGPGRG